MPSKKTSYWTTDIPYETYSSNLQSYWYDKPNQKLYVRFKNDNVGANQRGYVYVYHAVPESIYLNMHTAPSAGGYFHGSIRQSFRYENLGDIDFPSSHKRSKLIKNALNTEQTNLYKAFPNLKKLDSLDLREQALDKLYDKGNITSSQYSTAKDKLDLQRDKIIISLEKEGYSFDQDEFSDSDNNSQENNTTGEQKTLDIIYRACKIAFVLGKVCFQLVDIGFKIVFAVFAVFFGLLSVMK